MDAQVIDRAGLDALIALLRADGYAVIGPQASNGAIVYEPLESGAALPAGGMMPAPYQDPTNSDCFDYNVIRQSPPWEVPMHCGGHMPG